MMPCSEPARNSATAQTVFAAGLARRRLIEKPCALSRWRSAPRRLSSRQQSASALHHRLQAKVIQLQRVVQTAVETVRTLRMSSILFSAGSHGSGGQWRLLGDHALIVNSYRVDLDRSSPLQERQVLRRADSCALRVAQAMHCSRSSPLFGRLWLAMSRSSPKAASWYRPLTMLPDELSDQA